MKQRITIFTILLVLSATTGLFSQPLAKKQLEELSHDISSDEVYGYVLEMADPKYKGRLAGSPEYMDVARWTADRFREWGIEPAGDNGTYLQHFKQPYSDVFTAGSFSLNLDGKKQEYFAPEDYYPGSNAAAGEVEGELVFAGYGITAPDLGYDDYQEIDVQGKIVVIASGNPYKGDDVTLRNQWGTFSSGRYKLQNAMEQGASGAIYMDKLANPGAPYGEGFIYVHAGDRPVADIFNAAGKNPRELFKTIDETMVPQSFDLGLSAALTADTKYHPEGMTANVVGVIPGSDPLLKDEVIIMGGHLDGQGYMGLLFPSALDNASGVANVMGAARALAQLKGKLKRSVVFILFGAEETGLVGSEFYCMNPYFPAEQTVMFMNLDMVGNGKGLAVRGSESFPELNQHFVWANENILKQSLRTAPYRHPVGRPRTDGAMFSLNGFRAFSVGTTDRVNPLYYHDPRDTAELLVPQVMRDAARLLFVSTARVATDDSFRASDLPPVSQFVN